MRPMLLTALTWWIITLAAPTTAGAQHVWLHVPHDTVQVGERFPLIIVAEYFDDLDLILPEAEEDDPASIGDFELLRLQDRDVRGDFGQPLRDSLVFEATTFALDSASTRGATVSFAGAGDTLTVEVPEVEIAVASVVEEGESPRDLAPIVDLPLVLWPWILGGLLLLTAVALLVWWRRRRSPAEKEPTPPSALPPVEEARSRLRKLEDHPLADAEHQRLFVIELTDILRTYISRRLGIRAREMTSGEVVAALSQNDVARSRVADAQQILDISDRIKFARAEASERILRDSRASAGAWIEDMERQLQRREEESNEATAKA